MFAKRIAIDVIVVAVSSVTGSAIALIEMEMLWNFYYSIGSGVISDVDYASDALRKQHLAFAAIAGASSLIILLIGKKLLRPSKLQYETVLFVSVWFLIANFVSFFLAVSVAFNGHDWQSANHIFLGSMVLICILKIGDLAARILYSVLCK